MQVCPDILACKLIRGATQSGVTGYDDKNYLERNNFAKKHLEGMGSYSREGLIRGTTICLRLPFLRQTPCSSIAQ